MVFNSLEFACFLCVIFVLYWFVFNKSATQQNGLLTLASFLFYCWVDWRFLTILVFHAICNYFIAILIKDALKENAKKLYLYLGFFVNVGILGYFKYFDFFYEAFCDFANLPGHSAFAVIVPVGLSFFTFQSLGYLIDVYNGKIDPYRNKLEFFTYTCYFPKLLAGPIERAERFIPRIQQRRLFDNEIATAGLRQILWGLFKKIVIADNCALIVDQVFADYQNLPASSLAIGAFLYSMQIYADFSGYSDMAIGTSKLFNIELSINFNHPFFAINISEFWRKWHISLSSWMMDYIFTPLSFFLRRYKKIGLVISIIVTFSIVGLWHGANSTYLIFGVLNGLYFIPLIINGTMNRNQLKPESLTNICNMFFMCGTFALVVFTMIFLRAENTVKAFDFIGQLFSRSIVVIPHITRDLASVFVFITILFVAEWTIIYKKQWLKIIYSTFYFPFLLAIFGVFILLTMNTKDSALFIYFQY